MGFQGVKDSLDGGEPSVGLLEPIVRSIVNTDSQG
jgi:hypothetical protein